MATDESSNSKIIDLKDVIDTKARQLRAMLELTWGEETNGETFRSMSADLQDTYMWACSDMARDIVNALEGIYELQKQERSHV